MLSQLTDQSGNGNSGFTNNISSVKGFRDKSGKAGGFDGNSSFAQIPHNNLLNPSEITIFSLIKFNKFYNGLWTFVDNSNLQDGLAYTSGQYTSVNLLYYPVPNIMVGGEVLWGDLELNDGNTQDDTRVQFSVQYKWGKTF